MSEAFSRVRAEVHAAKQRHRVPGVAVGILNGGTTETAGFGITNVEHPLAVDGDTLFQIASNTKTFTGAAVLRLVEQGKLDLDAPLRSYIKELKLADPDVTAKVTLRHCLQHTGGWVGDFAPGTGRGDDALARYVALMAENPQLTPLGKVWSYNNAGFGLAGRVIEVATGQTYEAALGDLILEAVGMHRSCFFAEEAIARGTAAGHNVVNGEARVVTPWAFERALNPVGGLLSSANEMLKWAEFQLGDGTGILKRETLSMGQDALAPAAGMADAVGISWMTSDFGGARVVGHGGYAPGQMSAFRMVPDQSFAVVVLTNSALDGARLHGEVVNAAFSAYLGLTPTEQAHVDVPLARKRELVGSYTAALADLQLDLDGEHLRLTQTGRRWLGPTEPPPDVPPPARLAFTGDDALIAIDGPLKGTKGDILRDASGQVEWLRWAGRVHSRVR